MRYIEREVALSAIQNLNSVGGCSAIDRDEAENAIVTIPAADVVDVVKCRDCKRWKADGGYGLDLDGTKREYGVCAITNMAIKENCFCSFGARKYTEERE